MEEEKLVYYHHEYCIGKDDILNTQPRITNAEIDILSTDSTNDLEYITSFECNHYPIYGTMFHPEFAFLEILPASDSLNIA